MEAVLTHLSVLHFALLACSPAALGIAPLAPLVTRDSTIVAGRISDSAGTSLPGVMIKAIRKEDGKILQTTSRVSGNYIFSLEPGTYALTAEVRGFKKVTHALVVVAGGETRHVNFQMRLPAADHVDYVLAYNTLTEVAARSDAVSRAVLAHVGSAAEWEIGKESSVMGVLVTARVLEQLKGHGSSAPLQFLHFGSSSSYKAGQEYILFLVWDENVKHFVGLAGDNYMIKISNSRVTKTTPLEGVSIGMPVSRLLERLRSFLVR